MIGLVSVAWVDLGSGRCYGHASAAFATSSCKFIQLAARGGEEEERDGF